MNCPKCGVKVTLDGSFCPKCGKNVAYLLEGMREAAKQTPNVAEAGSELAEQPADQAEVEVQPAVQAAVQPAIQPDFLRKLKAGEVYYCNFCGSGVLSPDNFCFQCGKKTRKKFYRKSGNHKKVMLYLALLAVFCSVAGIAYKFSNMVLR